MTGQDDTLRAELARANRILAHEDVLDVFGHVSLRDPDDPGRYMLARARSPELVAANDILDFTLDSRPVRPTELPIYSERVIHGCTYQRRADVAAVVHLHAPAVLALCISGIDYVPVFHVGATLGPSLPFWSAHESFGDTNMLVSTEEQGRSLAAALGDAAGVLMRNHGAVVVGRNLREAVFRAVYLCKNCEMQVTARQLGSQTYLTPKEIELAGAINLSPPVLQRAWDYWCARLAAHEDGGPMPARDRVAS